MVFTHIPANLFLIGAAVAPTLPVAVVLILRAPPFRRWTCRRQSYTMAVVDPAERVHRGRDLAGAQHRPHAGSGAGGAFLIPIGIGAPLVVGGVLKIAYDVSLYALFRSPPRRKQRPLPCPAHERRLTCDRTVT